MLSCSTIADLIQLSGQSDCQGEDQNWYERLDCIRLDGHQCKLIDPASQINRKRNRGDRIVGQDRRVVPRLYVKLFYNSRLIQLSGQSDCQREDQIGYERLDCIRLDSYTCKLIDLASQINRRRDRQDRIESQEAVEIMSQTRRQYRWKTGYQQMVDSDIQIYVPIDSSTIAGEQVVRLTERRLEWV